MKLKHVQSFWVLALCVLLAGCPGWGIPKPETFNQRLAYGYSSVTTVRQTATILLKADKITADDAQQVQGQADNARAGLDVARTIASTDLQAADSKLTAVLVALNALDAYLKSRGEK